MKERTDRRKHHPVWQFVLDMHSKESNVSWTRWLGTIIISNIMTVWTLSCIFDEKQNVSFTLEDMPTGLLGVILTVIGGKAVEKFAEKK